MASVRTEYINSAGNKYGIYQLQSDVDLNASPTSGQVKVNNVAIASVGQIAIFDTDTTGLDSSLSFSVLQSGVFSQNQYSLVISNTNGLNPDTGNKAEFIRYNLTNATFSNDVLTLGLSFVDGTGGNISYGNTVYLRIYSDIDDTSSVTLATTQSELSDLEIYTIVVTTLG